MRSREYGADRQRIVEVGDWWMIHGPSIYDVGMQELLEEIDLGVSLKRTQK